MYVIDNGSKPSDKIATNKVANLGFLFHLANKQRKSQD